MDWFLYDNGLPHEKVKLEVNSIKIYHAVYILKKKTVAL